MLANEPLSKLEELIEAGRAGEYLVREYPARKQNLTPDTQDAADAANYRIYVWDRAEKKWPKLPASLQKKLLTQLQAVDPSVEEAELALLE